MNIHQTEEVLRTGSLETGKAVILLHGRGATAQGILQLSQQLPNAAYFAPQAQNHVWYPQSFLKPKNQNQPHLDSALQKINSIINKITKEIPKEKIVVAGFSQGACLATEYAAKNGGIGGVIGFSGGLIGKQLEEYSASLDDVPVFLGCAEKDPHIPKTRVDETEKILRDLGADVEKYIFEGSNHGIDDYELQKATNLIENL